MTGACSDLGAATAQIGYLPGTLWILVGVVIAGAVRDMTVLFLYLSFPS